MDGVYHYLVLSLLFLRCYISPLVDAGDALLAWSDDPEWYNEAQQHTPNNNNINNGADTTRSRNIISTNLKSLFAKSLYITYHFSSTPHIDTSPGLPLHSKGLLTSSYTESPEWFLVHDPEFFNKNLALLPQAQQRSPFIPHAQNLLLPKAIKLTNSYCNPSRRLLRPHHEHSNDHKLSRRRSLFAGQHFERLVIAIELWKARARSV